MQPPSKSIGFLFLLSIMSAVPGDGQQRVIKTEFHRGQEVAAGEVLVKFRTPAADAISRTRSEQDIDEMEEVGSHGVVRFHSASKNTPTLLRELSVRPDVEYAEPNVVLHAFAVPNDTQFAQQWGLQNTGQVVMGAAGKAGADIGATLAWNLGTGAQATVIGVVDTGVDYTHPDLAANVWSAPNAFTVTVGGVMINCAAGTHGFNAINNTCNPFDDNGHGTHVSGIIGAVGNNATGVSGVNWTASMMALKFLDAMGNGLTSNAVKAIDFAVKTKAALGVPANVRVLSNSWGCLGAACFTQSLLNEINTANASGMLFVAAAGNDANNNDLLPSYPGNYNAPNIISVAATDNRDVLAGFSNFGATTVHLAAPGVNILSTLPAMGFGYLSGTSMSTPYVSGAALLVLSTCVLDTAHLKSLLLTNVDVLPQLNLKVSTSGRLNLYNAYSSCRQGLLMIGPDTWHFPIVFPGDPPPHTGFTFTNTGGFPIRFLSKSFQSGSAFSIIGDTCGSLLAVSSSCVVTVQFNPALALPGTNVGTLTITDTLGTSPQTVTVTGSVSCTGSSCP